jgi:cobalt-zinc-cadmium efflux system outer membrane protein
MGIRSGFELALCALLATAMPASAGAQSAASPPPAPLAHVSIDDAVRLALERNQTLRAERLAIDASKADEITAGLKPNVNASFAASGLPAFSPGRLTFGTFGQDVTYDFGLGYTFERGGKREKRLAVARDATAMSAHNVSDDERQLRFQTEQAFVGVLLAKSTLELARQNLADFTNIVDINRARVASGDLAEGDFLKISVQQLQFQTDVSAAEVSLVQAKAALRQLVGYDTLETGFDVTGDLSYRPHAVNLDDLKALALASRPDLLAAQQATRLAQDQAVLERGNRARDVAGSAVYEKTGPSNTVGVGVAFDLPFRDRNQGNIAHADIAERQAAETEAATRDAVLTDVTSAYAAYQTGEQVLALYQSGYLDQTRQSLDVSTYAFQRGAASLLDLLDAERTYRDTQLAYRQAVATCLVNARQLNFVVGKQVIP